jgi:hypothetical protein
VSRAFCSGSRLRRGDTRGRGRRCQLIDLLLPISECRDQDSHRGSTRCWPRDQRTWSDRLAQGEGSHSSDLEGWFQCEGRRECHSSPIEGLEVGCGPSRSRRKTPRPTARQQRQERGVEVAGRGEAGPAPDVTPGLPSRIQSRGGRRHGWWEADHWWLRRR